MQIALIFAALSGATGVAFGAFGAHTLRTTISTRLMETFQTAVSYQMIHSLALIAVVILVQQTGRSTSLNVAALAFMLGIVLFSGSLYGLVLTDTKWFGPMTPLGGVCLIAGWLALLVAGVERFG